MAAPFTVRGARDNCHIIVADRKQRQLSQHGGRQEAENSSQTQKWVSSSRPIAQLARTQPLKVPQPPKTVPAAGDRVLKQPGRIVFPTAAMLEHPGYFSGCLVEKLPLRKDTEAQHCFLKTAPVTFPTPYPHFPRTLIFAPQEARSVYASPRHQTVFCSFLTSEVHHAKSHKAIQPSPEKPAAIL